MHLGWHVKSLDTVPDRISLTLRIRSQFQYNHFNQVWKKHQMQKAMVSAFVSFPLVMKTDYMSIQKNNTSPKPFFVMPRQWIHGSRWNSWGTQGRCAISERIIQESWQLWVIKPMMSGFCMFLWELMFPALFWPDLHQSDSRSCWIVAKIDHVCTSKARIQQLLLNYWLKTHFSKFWYLLKWGKHCVIAALPSSVAVHLIFQLVPWGPALACGILSSRSGNSETTGVYGSCACGKADGCSSDGFLSGDRSNRLKRAIKFT